MPHAAPFYVPYNAEKFLFYWLNIGAKLATRLFNVKSFTPWMAAVFALITIVLLNFVLKVVFGILF